MTSKPVSNETPKRRAPNRRAAPPKPTQPVDDKPVARQPVVGAEGVTCELMIVDAEMAHEFLSFNTHNRHISQARVKILARKMFNEEWETTGQSHFIFSKPPKTLLNGQHTANAIILANAIIETIVVTGIEHSAFDKIDIGWKRSLANMLNVEGHTNGTTLGACIRAVELYDSLEKAERGWTHSLTLEADELMEIFSTDADGFVKASTFGKYVSDQARKTGVPMSPGALGAFYYLAIREGHDPDAVEAYMLRLATDIGHDADDPTLSLRRWLTANRGGSTFVARDRGLTVLSILIKGYRAGEAGQTLKKVYAWTRESPDFPRL